jgi:cysteine desulfurase
VPRAPEAPEIYLDWNATTPPLPAVIEAMASRAADGWGNPSSVHAAGRRARALVEDAREAVAALTGRDPRDVVLTSGGTEANNLALSGARALVVSRLEHPSVTRVAESLEARGVLVRWLPVPETGRLEPGDVAEALAGLPPGAVVAVTAVNHETGVIQDVGQMAAITAKVGARLHVDAVQAIGRVPAELWRHGESLAVAAHKLRGPKGIGALVTTPGSSVHPVLLGGAQERGLRPGTVDPLAALGFGVAARHAAEGEARYARLGALRDRIDRELADVSIANGGEAPRAPHVTNRSFLGSGGDELVAALDLEGVRVSAGSACAAGTSEPSPVITAMLGPERARSAVRISLGEESDERAVEALFSALRRVLGRGDRRPSSIA